MRLISIVAGSTKDDGRISASRKLLNYGFRFFETSLINKKQTKITSVRIWKGEEEQLTLGMEDDLYITVPKGSTKKIKNNIKLEAMIEAPVKAGNQYGTLEIKLGDQVLASRPLIALNEIKEGGMLRKLSDNIQLMFQ